MLAPGLQGFGRNALGKGDLAFHLGVGALEFFVQIPGDVHQFPALDFDADGLGDRLELLGVFDGVIFDMAVDHLAEEVQHAHAVVGVGGAAGGDEPGEITGLDGVDRGAADTHFGIGVARVQAAGAHEAVLAAGRLRANGAGLHAVGALEGGFDAVAPGFREHLGRGVTDGEIPGVRHLLVFLLGDEFLFFFHAEFLLRGKIEKKSTCTPVSIIGVVGCRVDVWLFLPTGKNRLCQGAPTPPRFRPKLYKTISVPCLVVKMR